MLLRIQRKIQIHPVAQVNHTKSMVRHCQFNNHVLLTFLNSSSTSLSAVSVAPHPPSAPTDPLLLLLDPVPDADPNVSIPYPPPPPPELATLLPSFEKVNNRPSTSFSNCLACLRSASQFRADEDEEEGMDIDMEPDGGYADVDDEGLVFDSEDEGMEE
jgi:hypothetical protein